MNEHIAADFVVTNEAWKALPADLQKIVTDVMREHEEKNNEELLSLYWDKYYMKVTEVRGVKWTTWPEEDYIKLGRVGLEGAEDFVSKSTDRAKEAWAIVKPIIYEATPGKGFAPISTAGFTVSNKPGFDPLNLLGQK